MKYAILSLFIFGFCTARAAHPRSNYNCLVKANSELDFPTDIQVMVAPAALSGEMSGDDGDGYRGFGIVIEVEDLHKGDDRFDPVLQLFGTPELSGITDRSRVTRILVYSNHAAYDDESAVYRYFQGPRQIGGTLMLKGSPIACRP